MAGKDGNAGAGGDGKDVDPRLQALAQQLAGEAKTTYTERRLAELERRAAAKAAGTTKAPRAPAAASPSPGDAKAAPGGDWRDAVGARTATEPAPAPAPAPPPLAEPTMESIAAAARASDARPLVARDDEHAPADEHDGFDYMPWVRTFLSAWFVFGVAAAAQGSFMGFGASLVWRSFAAGTGAACLWRWLGPGRFRTALVGVACHMLAFVDVARVANRTGLFAVYLAAMLVLLGSGVIGLIREQRAFRI